MQKLEEPLMFQPIRQVFLATILSGSKWLGDGVVIINNIHKG